MEERVQSVLVAAGTSNGPMLSHSPPHYNKQSECSETTTDQFKDDFLHNGGKVCSIAFNVYKKRHYHARDFNLICLVIFRKVTAWWLFLFITIHPVSNPFRCQIYLKKIIYTYKYILY